MSRLETRPCHMDTSPVWAHVCVCVCVCVFVCESGNHEQAGDEALPHGHVSCVFVCVRVCVIVLHVQMCACACACSCTCA